MKNMKKILCFLLVFAMTFGCMSGMASAEENFLKAGSISAAESTVTEGQPFAKGTAGSNIFRIPCLITLKDEEHKGTLVAAADARYTEYRDFGGIDTIASVSKDGGETWNYSFPIYFPDSNGSAGFGQATTAIDPAIVEGPDGTIYCFADMNPTGVTTLDVYPLVGTGFVTVEGKERLALTANYSNASTLPTDDNTNVYGYYVGDFDENGYAKVLSRVDHSESGYAVDEWYNIYTINAAGEYKATLTQTQVNSDTMIQQNAFYKASALHVYNTGYIWCVKSYDGGMSWQDPEILNPQIKREDGKETALLVSPGQGITTSKGDIIVGAYNTLNGEDASIFYSTDNGKSWKRSNDVNVGGKSSENEIIELPDGTLRMFYRSDTAKICYADITRQVGVNGEVTYVIGEGKQTGAASNSNCNVSAILLEDTTIDEKPVILASNPEAPVSWTRVNGKIFVFTLNEDNTMNHVYTYSVNEGEFAYSCMTELDNGNIGMLWEPGINQASAIRYDEFEIDVIIGNVRNLTMDAGDTYVVTEEAESVAEIETAPDAKVATATSELEISEGIVPLYDLGSVTASSLDSFSDEINTNVNISDAEFTFNASGTNWKIYNEATKTYLSNVNSANTFFSSTANDMKVTASTEKDDMFTICRSTGSRFIIFHNPSMTFNSNTNWSANYKDGTYDLVLLEKQTEVSDGDIIPGYKQVDKITDGAKYLIAHIWSDGSVIVLYPANGTAEQTKLVGEMQSVKTSIVTITAVAPGTTTAKIGEITYNITVEDPTKKPEYAGRDIPVSAMTATAGSYYSGDGGQNIEKALDGVTTTIWHTDWKNDKDNRDKHWIEFELDEVYAVDGVRYLNRQDGAAGCILGFKVQVSADGNNWTDVVSDGTFENSTSWQRESFKPVETKYVRIKVEASTTDNSGAKFAAAAEIRLTGEIPVSVDKTDLQAIIAETEVLKAEEYTVESWEALEAALTAAVEVNENADATQEEVDAAVELLEAAIEALEEKEDPVDPEPDVPVVPSTPVTEEFKDVKEDDWFVDAVQYVYDNGIMGGNNNLFNPAGNITREQVVATLFNMEADKTVTDYTAVDVLKDLKAGQWYTDAVCWAYNSGVAQGNSTTKMFSIGKPITREQLAVMLYNYSVMKGYDVSASADYSGLKGANEVADYAAGYMSWAYGVGLIGGNGNLNPKGNTTRAQMASMMMQFVENVVSSTN